MASWMVHLRVADKLLSRIRFLDPVAFVVGNIAPDSGVPNEDWSAFMPSTKISHSSLPSGNLRCKTVLLLSGLSRTPDDRHRMVQTHCSSCHG